MRRRLSVPKSFMFPRFSGFPVIGRSNSEFARALVPAFVLVLIAVLAGPLSVQAQGFDEVQIETTDLGHGIYMLTGAGGNMAVSVGEDGVILIDDQFAPLTEKIKTAIRALSDQPVRFLINTHWHRDHVSGNENFGLGGSVIVAHENVRKRMSTDQFVEALDNHVPAFPGDAIPVITFTDAVAFHLNGIEIEVSHVEHAHTDGDAIVRFGDTNVIHMGDTFFNGLYPFVDTSTGGSLHGVIAAVESVLGEIDDETQLIPGHGGLGDRHDLQVYYEMLKKIRDRITEGISSGKTLEEVLAAGVSKEWDATWGTEWLSPEKFVTILFQDLSREK